MDCSGMIFGGRRVGGFSGQALCAKFVERLDIVATFFEKMAYEDVPVCMQAWCRALEHIDSIASDSASPSSSRCTTALPVWKAASNDGEPGVPINVVVSVLGWT